MKKLTIATYVLRILGVALILLCFLGKDLILNVFPGLEGHSINPFFYLGAVVYMVGAVIYFFINKKMRADRRAREIEDARRKAFGGADASKEGEN